MTMIPRLNYYYYYYYYYYYCYCYYYYSYYYYYYYYCRCMSGCARDHMRNNTVTANAVAYCNKKRDQLGVCHGPHTTD